MTTALLAFLAILAGIVVIITLGIEGAKRRKPFHVEGASPQQVELDARLEQQDEIRQLLQARQKIQAIKLYREETGVNLKEAKAAVERMEAGMQESWPQEQPEQTRSDLVDPARLQRLIREGRKIEAIKYFRQQRGVGLREAKDAVDWLEANMPAEQ
jgi:ribosomal protein L7/L12